MVRFGGVESEIVGRLEGLESGELFSLLFLGFASFGGSEMILTLVRKGGQVMSGAHGAAWEEKGLVRSVLGAWCPAMYCSWVSFFLLLTLLGSSGVRKGMALCFLGFFLYFSW